MLFHSRLKKSSSSTLFINHKIYSFFLSFFSLGLRVLSVGKLRSGCLCNHLYDIRLAWLEIQRQTP